MTGKGNNQDGRGHLYHVVDARYASDGGFSSLTPTHLHRNVLDLQVPALHGLAVGLGGHLEGGRVDPAVLPDNLLGNGHAQVLGVPRGAHELGRLEEGLHSAGVRPGVAAAESHHGECVSSIVFEAKGMLTKIQPKQKGFGGRHVLKGR